MSEALPEIDVEDVDAVLNEALRVDMALLRHVNAQALATTEPDILNGYVRSQAKLTRSLRTTLTTRARLRREQRQDDREAAGRDDDDDDAGEAPHFGPDDVRYDLEEAALVRVRLEYDPAEVDAIDEELGLIAEAVVDADPEDALTREERIEAMMRRIRTMWPSRRTPVAESGPAPEPEPEPETEPEPAPEPDPDPEPDPPPPPEPPPPAAPPPDAAPRPPDPEPPKPYVPPWELLRPGERWPGGGSGW